MAEKLLIEVIEERIKDFKRSSSLRKNKRKYKYLLHLRELALDGVVLSMGDRRFLDELQKDRPVNRCVHCSPTGKCPLGKGRIEDDRCPHWGNWIKSAVTCSGYDPEQFSETRF